MAYLLITLSLFISIILSRLIIPRILVVAHRKKLFDIPDERKVHSGIIPRLGGVSFVPTILFSLAFVTGLRYIVGLEIAIDKLNFIIPEFYFMVCGLMLLYLSGIKDDLVGLRYRSKFIIQTIVACFIPLSGLWINNLYGLFGIHELTPWLGIPFTIFLTVFIVNAINLIDGIDGLASGLAYRCSHSVACTSITNNGSMPCLLFLHWGCYFLSSIIMYSDRPTVAKKYSWAIPVA